MVRYFNILLIILKIVGLFNFLVRILISAKRLVYMTFAASYKYLINALTYKHECLKLKRKLKKKLSNTHCFIPSIPFIPFIPFINVLFWIFSKMYIRLGCIPCSNV